MKAEKDAAGLAADPQWYKDAVIYELHVKAFFDSNDDGIGDFHGLTEKLDYVADLGVNTIWLLPFYPSPFRDDGYDVSDYRNVHPAYGTRQDFRALVREAHKRELRIITELVVNHTSDEHPWFQAARRAPKGSPKRNYYVWSDDPGKYAGTRIIFTDTEKSNWTWDEVAQQYYWHRFFSHQPDLNFDNPHVRQAVIRTMRFWLDMGVDGFRLDAIPYLIERDGTSNENLRETHAVIKEIRASLDENYTGKLLLAEANMWPEDVREYFGDGDECHMAYHFPLMPRMFMAIAQEDRHPIVEIMQQTPDIPESCQWSIFLRNHDELTLEMVTSKERDYMYNMFAADKRSRINLGIRRRLAPLMENDRERIKLMNSLLLSMPGSPVLYYGDEIGMGDNIFLGDRDGVRTPMQWTSDRNGGFSRADPQRVYLPPIQDPVYGFEAINVEAQLRAPGSLLNWTRRMLAVRKTSSAFGRGSFKLLHPGNRKVLAYLREYGDDVILCVANVSRSAQPVELDLASFKGRVPVEMTGRNAFPPLGELPYMLTLPGHAFYWFRLSTDTAAPEWYEQRLAPDTLPVLVLFDGWASLFRDHVVPWRIGMAEKLRAQFERELAPPYVQRQRWFAAKGERIERVQIVEHARLEADQRTWLLALADVLGPRQTGRYFLPLALAWDDGEEERIRNIAPGALAKVRQQAAVGLMGDAMADDAFCHAIVDAIGASRVVKAGAGQLRFVPTRSFADLARAKPGELSPVKLLGLSSNSVAVLGSKLFLKAYRRIREGINPELEVGRFLTDVVKFPHCVPVAGHLEYVDQAGAVSTLALLQACVDNQGDAWTFAVDALVRYLEAAGAAPGEAALPDGFVALVRTLAVRTAQLHAALAQRTGDDAFDPEPVLASDIPLWVKQVHDDALATIDELAAQAERLPQSLQPLAAAVVAGLPRLLERLEACAQQSPQGLKTRYHGDYHLGQVLLVNNDFVIIDFEGEPARSLPERRHKHSALRDVAGMLRSFDYARHTALQQATQHEGDVDQLAPVAAAWLHEARAAFLDSYCGEAIGAGLYASGEAFAAQQQLIELFELEKALYELRYELANRPDWVGVPLRGMAALAGLDENA
ncbi:maltose alpha-D-glucosyltransferase [Candidatus Accumulibacter sp. ACC003]|uniref:maltose alpha-D-glucosyltransferase n=1 Tax=Candidatus Accumulibacter sp. ACC003 TaxID=2823334 RepID=UPI0025BF9E77|nr:maltose alpha-D-glucosyltransferase [Candidatus Accumulibacter sp. ACC003]